MRPAVRNPDVMLRDADRHAAEEGRRAARDVWVEERAAQIPADDDDLEDAMDLYAESDVFDLMRTIALRDMRAGASDEGLRLRELLDRAAEAMALAESRDVGP